jgi:hypothetical protein
MIAPLAKLMDWSAIQIVAMMMPADAFDNPRLTEALQFLNGPDFVLTDSEPAQVEFNGSLHFRFPTPRPCACTENNVVGIMMMPSARRTIPRSCGNRGDSRTSGDCCGFVPGLPERVLHWLSPRLNKPAVTY